ncbi:vegetative incompatibility protein HET-E-1 [Staphylotrichum tortipilum]|uniref:Vegetative incompatibility protein HET-E-1 n=1 Tax=Staphylotrichum tortipilum TaxID=2831512 RepID=A0AAN6RRE4_9PEZI|nr:vegetative incompatibility protein HET-E-1 [Staphylotrichum longicolle]
MRLLNTVTLQLEEFFDTSTPPYAILSHTWGKDEVLFRDLGAKPDWDHLKKTKPSGLAKVLSAHALAAAQNYDYIWIDTCCIDKSSSAELSEAINSMFRYYRESAVCYAYLSDVNDVSQLSGSRWFTRGWTLQELIAPRRLELYTANWTCLGEKQDPALLSAISAASLVDEYVLTGAVAPNAVSVAKRMYWASARTTTRKEDEAYCLMGLFDVNMPLLYGEGEKAFGRLQREITKITDDQSIFAWYGFWVPGSSEVFACKTSCCAPSPRCFALSGNITPLHDMSVSRVLGHIDLTVAYSEFSAIVAEETKHANKRTIVLNCQIGPIPGTFPTLTLVEWQNTRHYIRDLVANKVTQLSLHGGPDRFSCQYRMGPIGIQVDPKEKIVARETAGAEEPTVMVAIGKGEWPSHLIPLAA